jgi:membrane-bound metal-dependent hydrolase YbcI (DUF457 family)
MTGKTHMAVSAAAVALSMALTGVASRPPAGVPHLLSAGPGASKPSAFMIGGLLLLGIVAGLFPDLDAPESELGHLPRKVAKLARYVGAGGRKRSALAALTQGLVRTALLPLSLLLSGVSAALRTFTGHRGFTHTIWGALTFTGLAATATVTATGSIDWSLTVGAVWLLGYASHLAADACTPSGIPLFGGLGSWTPVATDASGAPPSHTGPLRTRARHTGAPRYRAFHLLPRRMLVRTGTFLDTLVVRWVSWGVFLTTVVILLAG